MASIRVRDACAAALIAACAGAVTALPALDVLHGLSIDALTALRWHVYGPMHVPAASPAVVVALDEETYRTPPFAGTPNITWTHEIATVLNAVVAGGAKVVGFDIVFPTSIEQSQIPFGDETLGAKVRGFDGDFLRALALGGRAGKVVLGEAQHSDYPLLPAPAQRIAVGRERNIRSLNAYTDKDDVIRRMPLSVVIDGTRQPSMSVELAARALGATPEIAPDGVMTLAGYRIPSAVRNTLTVNFDGGAGDIPTFSLADLRACVDKGDTDFFRRYFDGKVVIIGTRLDVEDRQITSKRFATEPEGADGPRCVLPAPATGKFARDAIAGVYIHATAVDNLIDHDALVELGRLSNALIAIAFSSLAALTVLFLPLLGAVIACVSMAGAWTEGAIFAFKHAVSLPLIEPLLAGGITVAATTGYRFLIADKDRRFLRRSFGLYLAPAVIERMMTSKSPPALGGETRNVTVFFSDVAGFSGIAEQLTPTDLVALMNEYLSAMTDIVQEYGGFVDKYIGDAIVAIFGAPLDDPEHAANAVRAAIRCHGKLNELNRTLTLPSGRKLGHRIGLNSGDALVGNIGSRQRFNYTVMGDVVNLASRLEGANKYFGTSIMVSESTYNLAQAACMWRELDVVRVVGRAEPVRIYEPLSLKGEETPQQAAGAAIYAKALACWRARDFAACAEALGTIVDIDPASLWLRQRAQIFAQDPPRPDWDSVNAIESK
ncbi:MAG TPA: adenylate/guanylate cyclase domain-containing protein [Xanthobacteraceae bacterium]|jgi:class 3 adenylate cyclase